MKIRHLKGASLFALIITSLMAILLLTPPKMAGFSGSGSGTAEDPYMITAVGQLQEMKDNLTAHYALGNDIDASDTVNWNGWTGFEPIGTGTTPFTGSFDGRGYKIYGLYIQSTKDGVGLFGCVENAVVENVGLENVSVIGSSGAGGLVGSNGGTVSNSYSTGSVRGSSGAGGLVGWNGGTVSNSYSTATARGSSFAGGLVGSNVGTISNSYSTSHVSGELCGGLVGGNYGTISNSYSTGSVNGGSYAGGLVGWNGNGGTVSNSYSTGYGGSLVGNNTYGTVSNSFWDNQTSGASHGSGGTGKTTVEMKNVRTYTDNTWSENLTSPWDFVGNPYGDAGNEDIWDINQDVNDGYPFLAVAMPSGEGTKALTNWPVIAGIAGAIVVIGVVGAVYMKRR